MQKKKIAGYVRAKRLMDQGKTQTEACQIAGLSRMTFNKYKEMFGDIIPGTDQIEVLPKQEKTVPVSMVTGKDYTSDLERLKEENTLLQEQLKLRQELAKYVH